MSVNSPPPHDLPVSFYLVKQCKLWVWDFDDTIINTDAYLKRDMKPSTIRNLKNSELDIDCPQWRYFKRLIEFLVMHGKYVAIASFGTYEIIRAYMDRIFGFNQKFFNKRNTVAPCLAERDTRRFSVPPNKNEYIYQLMKIYRIQDFGRVVLFDDMPSNISSAIGIGVIGVQIATPRNGDRDTSKMYFGPWIMGDLDKKLKNDCCNGLNNDKANLGMDFPESSAVANFRKSAFGMNSRQRSGPDSGTAEPKSAFGTGIGDRKISKKPEYRWNKMNVQNAPLWQNGNWQTNGGNMTMETLPIQDSTLGGFSYSFWDDNQSVNKPNSSGGSGGSGSRNDGNDYRDIDSMISGNIIEGFESSDASSDASSNANKTKSVYNNVYNTVSRYNNNYRKDKVFDKEKCESCNKISWNWITLCLMVIIFMMVAICFSIR